MWFPSLLGFIYALLILHVLLPAARKVCAFYHELVRYKECHPSVLFAVLCPLFDKYFDVLFELQINYLLKTLVATTWDVFTRQTSWKFFLNFFLNAFDSTKNPREQTWLITIDWQISWFVWVFAGSKFLSVQCAPINYSGLSAFIFNNALI